LHDKAKPASSKHLINCTPRDPYGNRMFLVTSPKQNYPPFVTTE